MIGYLITTIKKLMENKLTPVEWIVEQIENGKIEIIYSDKIHSIKCIPEIIEQAKAMEKEQHGATWDAAIKAYMDRGHNVVRAIVDFDEYYKEKTNNEYGKS